MLECSSGLGFQTDVGKGALRGLGFLFQGAESPSASWLFGSQTLQTPFFPQEPCHLAEGSGAYYSIVTRRKGI